MKMNKSNFLYKGTICKATVNFKSKMRMFL